METPKDTPETKRCPCCGETKPRDQFYRNKAQRDGLTLFCKLCHAERNRRWVQHNPDSVRASKKRWSAANLEKLAELQRCRRQNNPERARENYRHYRASHLEEINARNRSRYAANPEKSTKRQKRWDQANPERKQISGRAVKIVYYAIRRGRLIRPNICEQCGGPGPIEAAHADYSRPLEVRWLCRPCHRKWDYEKPKTLSPLSKSWDEGRGTINADAQIRIEVTA